MTPLKRSLSRLTASISMKRSKLYKKVKCWYLTVGTKTKVYSKNSSKPVVPPNVWYLFLIKISLNMNKDLVTKMYRKKKEMDEAAEMTEEDNEGIAKSI
jgi:hypothetical protein